MRLGVSKIGARASHSTDARRTRTNLFGATLVPKIQYGYPYLVMDNHKPQRKGEKTRTFVGFHVDDVDKQKLETE